MVSDDKLAFPVYFSIMSSTHNRQNKKRLCLKATSNGLSWPTFLIFMKKERYSKRGRFMSQLIFIQDSPSDIAEGSGC